MTHLGQIHRGMVIGFFVALLAVLVTIPSGIFLNAADHRDSPLAGEDPTTDINDVYIFRSPEDDTKVIIAMTVNGFAVPAVRASYSFGTEVLYQFKIDNTGDAKEDLVLQVLFDGFETLRDSRCPAPGGGQFVTVLGPAKPSDDGADARVLKKGPRLTGCTNAILGPSADGIRAWAGLAADAFVVDIGQFNRILGGSQDVFRDAPGTPVLGDLRGRPVRADGTSGVDSFGGFNASTIVLEVPIALLQGTKNRTSTYLANNTTVGFWGTTSRPMNRHLSSRRVPNETGRYIQVQRMGHQVFKTVFLPTSVKDTFNRSVPATDTIGFSQFIPDALTTTDNDTTGNTIAGRAAVLDAILVTALPGGAPLLTAGLANTDRHLIRKVLIPDVLRINLDAPAADVGVASNGLQNGRRLNDDVIDIVLRLSRELADVKFPDGSGLPGSGALGTRRALDCSALPCQDRRVLAVLQGTDFIELDSAVEDLSTNGDDIPLLTTFPFFSAPHPLPGAAGTVGFPPQE